MASKSAIDVKFEQRQQAAVAAVSREYYFQLRERIREFSDTIADTLTISRQPYKTAKGSWRMRIASPYFFSGILDFGRRAVQGNPLLIWFRNIEDDPRVDGGTNYPKTYQEAGLRRLTQAQYEYGLQRNREAYDAGQDPYMLVRPASREFLGFNFTTQAFTRLSTAQKRIALEPLKQYAKEVIQLRLPGGSFRIF
jgi:hypothetical protein